MATRKRATLLAAFMGFALACSTSEDPNVDDDVAPIGESDAGRGAEMPNGESDGAAPTPPSTPGDAGDPSPGQPADAGQRSDAATPESDASAPTCPTLALPVGEDMTVMLEHDGVQRSYIVHVGESADTTKPVPLVLNFHGLNNNPGIQAWFSAMTPRADERGFIVVYPTGLDDSFAAGSCCGMSGESGVDDLGFARAIVSDVIGKACVDRKRIYATGFSNGGYMAHHLGCRASDLFAAIAPIAGANATEPCAPGRAVPVFAINSDPDPIVPYASGHNAALSWAERNGCEGEPVREQLGSSFCDVWSACNEGVEVRFCTWKGGTHLWPGTTTSLPASTMLLDFFERFTLP